MGRYDAPELVRDWEESGAYPKIHDAIYGWAREILPPRCGMVLDLCSSTGLLARRLARAGYRTCAVTMPGPALDLGRDAGVYEHTPVLGLKIEPSTLPALDEWIRDQQVRVIVARRALPELWDALGSARDVQIMAEMWADAGVRHILLEGRANVGRSTHPLRSVRGEAWALGPRWRCVEERGALAYLVPL